MNSDLRKELRKSLKAIKSELVEKERLRQTLITHNTDFALLEEFINDVNNNPDLIVKMTLKDGTVLELSNRKPKRQKTYTEMLGEYDG